MLADRSLLRTHVIKNLGPLAQAQVASFRYHRTMMDVGRTRPDILSRL